MLCPKCSDRAHRSHRTGWKEHLAGLAGFFPYVCGECHNRFLQYRYSVRELAISAQSGGERKISATRSALAWKRKRREMLLYGLALLLFVAILYFLTRAPSLGA